MTDRYAVIGNPIGHSKSPLIHTRFAQLTGQDIAYGALQAPLGGFERAVLDFREGGGRGVNITAPFKLQACELATERSPHAELAGAANAIKFDGERILAENFDGIGLLNDIQRNLGFAVRGKRLLLLGAGGAARGALLPLLGAEPAELVIANRSASKARALASRFAERGRLVGCGLDELAGARFDLVINATSASQTAEGLPLPAQVFGEECLAYELVYGKGMTPFLRSAQEAGVRRLVDGVGMLVEQAAEAFVWWRGVRPQTRPVIEQLRVPLV